MTRTDILHEHPEAGRMVPEYRSCGTQQEVLRRFEPSRNSALVTRLIVDILRSPMFAPGISRRLRATSATPPAHRFSPCRRLAPATAGPLRCSKSFTLLELLIVVGIIGLLLVLIAPAFTYIKGGNDVTSAAYSIKGALDTARTYAKANNTYAWVGFYEEDVTQPSTSPAAAGTGRIVMSTVASKDGTMLYTTPLTTLVPLPSGSLIQVGKLTKLDNLHLKAFSAGPGTPPADNFDTRPPYASVASQIGDTAPPNASLQFVYPLGGTQYAFQKIVQFSPRGEAVIDNSNYTMATVSEIGVQPTHGTTVDSTNSVAIQFTGIGANVRIYRK